MQIHSKDIMTTLQSHIDRYPDPQEGDLVISPHGILETCAPYIGRMCAEFLDGEWCVMPYSRDTEYFSSLDEVQAEFDLWQQISLD